MKDGDESALAAMIARYQNRLTGHIRGLAPAAPAEDIAQDVFVSFWASAGRFDPDRGTLSAYLKVIARGKMLDWARSEAAQGRREHHYGRRPADHGSDRSDVVAIRSAVESLPAEQHQAVWLAYYMGYTYRQVATILAIAEGTAKTRIRTGLSNLRTVLAANQSDGYPTSRPDHNPPGRPNVVDGETRGTPHWRDTVEARPVPLDQEPGRPGAYRGPGSGQSGRFQMLDSPVGGPAHPADGGDGTRTVLRVVASDPHKPPNAVKAATTGWQAA